MHGTLTVTAVNAGDLTALRPSYQHLAGGMVTAKNASPNDEKPIAFFPA